MTKLKIAFSLFKYFPYGGLQRDFLRIAQECQRRGHEVDVYTMAWDGDIDQSLSVKILPAKGLTNHSQARSFSAQMEKAIADANYDLVVGFNKMPHLDLYYAADVCYQARIKAKKGLLYRLTPRYQTWKRLEKSVFSRNTHTGIMLISPLQQQEYQGCYATQSERFHLLPPGINRDRLAGSGAAEMGKAMRQQLGVADSDLMLLMVGSGYKTKGVDRAIRSIAALPDAMKQRCKLFVVGKGDAKPFRQLARQLGVEKNMQIMGARPDVPRFLLAADLLLHPSYHENTGTAILEALAAGLPVLTTAVCGYAHFVTDAHAGEVLPAQFDQDKWNQKLEKMLSSADLKVMGQNGFEFAKSADIYSMPERAADLIEQQASARVIS